MDIYSIPVKAIDGSTYTMDRYRGHALLIVNVASACGYTPQYTGLEALYRKYKDAGFTVLGFPCDQFGRQEPGTEEEIQQFCSLTYDVTFPLFSKVDVNGANAHPLFQFLKSAKKGILGSEAIKWNFSKFLVSPTGEVLKRYGSNDKPEAIEADLKTLVATPER
jgi:glutathione peroxidase